MRLVFARSAEYELEEISDWIAGDNPSRAVSFVVELQSACRDLIDFPESAPVLIRRNGRAIRRKTHGH